MNKILEIKFGSHLYGTSTPESDLDLKGIYLPTAEEILLHSYKKTITTSRAKQEGERNKKDDIDIEIFSLDRFLELLMEGQTVALDMLFAPTGNYTLVTPETLILGRIYDNRHELLHKNVNAFVGYARKQAAKYGVKGFRVSALKITLDAIGALPQDSKLHSFRDVLQAEVVDKINNPELAKFVVCSGPNGNDGWHLEVCGRKIPLHAYAKYAKEIFGKIYAQYGQRAHAAQQNYGVDWKALSHAVRVNCEAVELLETGFVTFPRPEKDLLLKIKLGQMPYSEVEKIIENGLEQLKVSEQKSTLRAEPNREFANALILEIYGAIVKRS